MTNRTHIPLTPLGDRLAVILDPKLAQSSGGIVIPERAQEIPSWGTVISNGPDAQHCIPGDRVYVPTHLGTAYIAGVGAEAVSLVIIHEAKVLAREERTYKLATGQDRSEEEISSDATHDAPANIVGFARPLPDQVNPLGEDFGPGLPILRGCSACGEDHEMDFQPIEPEVIEGVTYDRKGVCPTTEIDVYLTPEKPADPDDDLGEFDQSKACKVGNPGCESCE